MPARRELRAIWRWTPRVAGAVAIVSLAASFYLASSMVLFEAGCHLSDPVACERLSASRRAASAAFFLGISAIGVAAVAAAVRRWRD